MPAVASRYWRIGFRSAITSGTCHLVLSTLKVLNASLVDQTASATVTAANLRSGDSVTSWSDNSDTTTATLTFSAGTTFQYVTYDFGSGNTASLNSFLIRVSTLTPSEVTTTRIAASDLDMLVQTSSDDATWLTQTVLSRPLATDDTDYYMAMLPDSLYYPVPSRTQNSGTGGIYGIVAEDGVALPNRPVILYDRDDFTKIGYATTDVNGGYAFNGLNENREYLVMSVDPSGPPYKNALVYDRITPINTRTQLQTQSPFWAQRLRDPKFGFSFAITQFVDGVTYNNVEIAPGSAYSNLYGNNASDGFSADYTTWPQFDGYTTLPLDGAAGAFKFLKSNRLSSTQRGTGLISTGAGHLGNGLVNDAADYADFSFEVICVAPLSTESPLIVMWPSSTSDGVYWDEESSFTFYSRTGPVIEVTPTAARFRIELGGNNLATIRASAPVVQNQVVHIVATFAMESATGINLYINGVLQATASTIGAGRPYNHRYNTGSSGNDLGANFNVGDSVGVLKRISGNIVFGTGVATNNAYPPGFGGAFGAANWWGRVLSQSDVTKLYNSFANVATFVPEATQSGYAAEVEADNPSYYFRLNDTSMPANGFTRPLIGRKTANLYYREGTVFGANANFVAGNTGVDFSNSAGAYIQIAPFSTTFSVEMWVRPTSLSVTTSLFAVSGLRYTAPTRLSLSTSGILTLTTVDISTTTSISFSHTPLAVNTSYHIVVTYDPWTEKTAKLYINGALVDTKNAPLIFIPGDSLLVSVGCRVVTQSTSELEWTLNGPDAPSFQTDHFRGVMGEFAWYNHRLTAARIQAHYDARNY